MCIVRLGFSKRNNPLVIIAHSVRVRNNCAFQNRETLIACTSVRAQMYSVKMSALKASNVKSNSGVLNQTQVA